MKKIILLAPLAAMFAPSSADAQSGCPYLTAGAVLTPAQWNSCFQAKQDKFGGTPITGITGTAPVSVTAGANPVVSVALATSAATGVVQPDNTTIVINGSGIISAIGAVASSIDAGGATSISNGTNGYLLYDNSGKVGATNNIPIPLTITAGTLSAGAQAFTITGTQPASPSAAQNAIIYTITSAGSASQNNGGMLVTYAAGYTGSNRTTSFSAVNSVAGTANAMPGSGSNTIQGNTGGTYSSIATTTGFNFGLNGSATGGNLNVGAIGVAQIAKNSATNVGVAGYAINTGTSPVQIGVLASLNPGVIPAVSAALISDNGSQANPVALFQQNGTTRFQVDQNGSPAVPGYTVSTLPSSNNATGALAYVSDASVCSVQLEGGGSAYCLTQWNGSSWVGVMGRYKLAGTAPVQNTYNWYVNGTSGSDSNPGTSGSPWQHCQYAVDFLAQNIDANAQKVVLNIVDASQCTPGSPTYPGIALLLKPIVGAFDDWQFSPVVLQGSSTSWNCGSLTCVEGLQLGPSGWRVQGFVFSTSGAPWIAADTGAHIYVGSNTGSGAAVPFGAAFTNSLIEFVSGATITDNDTSESSFGSAQDLGQIINAGAAFFITNAQNYTGGFWSITRMGSIAIGGSSGTYIGAGAASSTGATFNMTSGGALHTGGRCANHQGGAGGTGSSADIPGSGTGNTLAGPGGTVSGWCT